MTSRINPKNAIKKRIEYDAKTDHLLKIYFTFGSGRKSFQKKIAALERCQDLRTNFLADTHCCSLEEAVAALAVAAAVVVAVAVVAAASLKARLPFQVFD